MSCEDKPITMNLYYTGENGNARRFVEEMESGGTADAIRAEEGNLRYDYFVSEDDPETVLLIDSWAGQKALDAHHRTPMMGTISALREKYNLTMRAERYYRADDDLTANDAKYIRVKEDKPADAQIDVHSHRITASYMEFIQAHGAEMDEGFPIPSCAGCAWCRWSQTGYPPGATRTYSSVRICRQCSPAFRIR